MATTGPDPISPAESSPAWQARCLLRAARSASLATARDGQPYVALVTPATAGDLSILLLLSTLSEHTRQLAREPRCALLVSAAATAANPQTTPRVTFTCLAAPEPDTALKARYLSIHPYARLYADFADFALWRLAPTAAMLVGGFARADRIRREALLPEPAAVASLAAAEADILTHVNGEHADALAAIAGRPGAWRLLALDTDGFDLGPAEDPDNKATLRHHWSAPVHDADGVRAELIRLARAARGLDAAAQRKRGSVLPTRNEDRQP